MKYACNLFIGLICISFSANAENFSTKDNSNFYSQGASCQQYGTPPIPKRDEFNSTYDALTALFSVGNLPKQKKLLGWTSGRCYNTLGHKKYLSTPVWGLMVAFEYEGKNKLFIITRYHYNSPMRSTLGSDLFDNPRPKYVVEVNKITEKIRNSGVMEVVEKEGSLVGSMSNRELGSMDFYVKTYGDLILARIKPSDEKHPFANCYFFRKIK